MINVFNGSSDCNSTQEAFGVIFVLRCEIFSFFLPFTRLSGTDQIVPSQLNVVSKNYIYMLINLNPAIEARCQWLSCYSTT